MDSTQTPFNARYRERSVMWRDNNILLVVVMLSVCLARHVAAGEAPAAPDPSALFELARIAKDRVLFEEGFEEPEAVKLSHPWRKGPSEVVFSGPTDEEASSGKRSYKIVVTFLPGRNAYAIFCVPKAIPVWSDLKLTMRIKMTAEPQIRVGTPHGLLGANAVVGESGYVAGYKAIKTGEEKGWEVWEASATRDSNAGHYVMGSSVYLQVGEVKVPTTVTVYLDDVVVEGRLPEDWEKRWADVYRYYTEYYEQEQRAGAVQRLSTMAEWQSELQDRFAKLNRLKDAAPVVKAQYDATAETIKALLEKAAPLVAAAEKGLADKQRRFSADVNAPEHLLIEARRYLEIAEAYGQYTKEHTEAGYVTYALDITQSYPILPTGPTAHNEELSYYRMQTDGRRFENPQILPDVNPVPAKPSRKLANFGCRGTYVPYSFAIRAGAALEQLTFTAGDMTSSRGKIPASQMDIRVVTPVHLPWGDSPRLFNCMLLHDPEFVAARPDGKNRFKDAKYGSDVESLLPVTIPAGKTRQFYLLVKIPDNATAGVYRGIVHARSANGKAITFKTELDLLDLDLEPTPYAYSAFCRSWLAGDEARQKEGIHGWRKSFAQLSAEMKNMGEHGFNTLNLYTSGITKTDDGWNFTVLDRLLKAAVEAGLDRSPFTYLGGAGYWMPYTRGDRPDAPDTIEKVIERLTERVTAINAFCREKGYPQPAYFGVDERSGKELADLRRAYQAVNDVGGLVTVACYPSYFQNIGTALSLPIVLGGGQTAVGRANMRASREAGYECWIYNCPPTSMHASPSVFRRRYGLMMWKNHEQGAAPWAYGDMGTYDFDERKGRTVFVFAFPTWSGKPVDSIIYEAYREGVYDARYMATLAKHLKEAKARRTSAELVARIENWLASFSVNDDLQRVRRQMADLILALRRSEK